MKKLIPIFLSILLFSSILIISTSATQGDLFIYEDLNTISYENIKYTKQDCATIGTYEDSSYYISIDHAQLSRMYTIEINDYITHPDIANKIKTSEIYVDNEKMYIIATFYLTDGSVTTNTYINEQYITEYNEVYSFDNGSCVVDFYNLSTERNIEFGWLIENESEMLKGFDYEIYEEVYVFNMSAKKNFNNYQGQILVHNNSYYYADYDEIGIMVPFEYNFFNLDEKIPVHKITNEQALEIFAEIDDNYYSYYYEDDIYSDFYSIYDDGELTLNFTLILCILFFGALPLTVFVISLVFGLQKKGSERKILLFVSVCSLVVLVVAIAVFIIVKTH